MNYQHRYCDNCGKPILSCADKLIVDTHDRGITYLDLCWKCGPHFQKMFAAAKESAIEIQKRAEALTHGR